MSTLFSKIKRITQLIQKAHSQPLILHKLYLHLRDLLGDNFIPFETEDIWYKLIIYGAVKNILPSQAIEMKLLKLIKNIKIISKEIQNSVEKSKELEELENEKNLKIIIICYYLINRPTELTNHIVLFDLVTNFIGISNFIDSLIIKILKRMVLSSASIQQDGDNNNNNKIYKLKQNRKLSRECILKMVDIINMNVSELSDENQVQFLPCCIFYRGNINFNFNQILKLFNNNEAQDKLQNHSNQLNQSNQLNHSNQLKHSNQSNHSNQLNQSNQSNNAHDKTHFSLFSIKFLESLFFYMKYSVDPTDFMKDLGSYELLLIPMMEKLINHEILIKFNERKNCVNLIEDLSLYKYIEKKFKESKNKEKFIYDLQEYLDKLI